MKGLVNIVKVVLMKEVEHRGRIHHMVEVAHNNDLFLGLQARLNEKARVLKKKSTGAFRDVKGEKMPVLLSIRGVICWGRGNGWTIYLNDS